MASTTVTSLLAKTRTSQYEFQHDSIHFFKKMNLGSQFKKKQYVKISEFPKYVEEDL